jgi:hypothetical protein
MSMGTTSGALVAGDPATPATLRSRPRFYRAAQRGDDGYVTIEY